MQEILDELELALKKYPIRSSKQIPESYIGGGQSQLRFLGVRVPDVREVLRSSLSFSNQSEKEIAKIWHLVWKHSDCYEVMLVGLSWFDNPKRRSLLLQEWPKLKNWSLRVDNWAHADGLSSLYARVLEEKPEVLTTLKQWNQSKHPWQRRLSIVSLLYYSKQRKKVLPAKTILSLVDAQLDFNHYYVQKAVGWTLRECSNVYPEQTYAYLKKNIQRITSHAFSAATEKLSKSRKAHLKRLRKPR